MIEWFFALDPRVQAALIAAVVGLVSSTGAVIVKHFLDKRSLRNRLEVEFEYEQRRELKKAIGDHLGLILERGERLDHRLWNFQKNEHKGWLDVGGAFEQEAYYFRSFVYRFTSFFAVIRSFFDEAIYIDARYTSGDDVHFIRHLKALEWAVTDVALFEGLDYDEYHETDHLFRGNLHAASEALIRNRSVISPTEFDEYVAGGIAEDDSMRSIYRFFDGMNSAEERLRWDRLVTLHLLLMAFMAAFGYDFQRPSTSQFREIAATIRNPEVASQLFLWLETLGLAKHASGSAIRLALAYEFPEAGTVGIVRRREVEKFLER